MLTAAALAVEFSAEGVPQTEQAIDRVGRKVQDSGASTKAAGIAMAGAATAAAAGFLKATGVVADYEAAMSGLKAVTNVTAGEMAALDALALKIGADTAFTASEGAVALTELAKAGVSVKNILAGAGVGATDFAAATDTAVEESARIMANALNVWGLGGEQATHVADVFAAASNKSAADAHELGLAMSQAGNVLTMFSVGFEESIGALAAFHDFGLRASDAGTSLKSALLALTSQSKPQKEVMRDYGLAFHDLEGNFIGLEGVAAELQRAFAGVSEEARNNALSVLFGSDGVRAANILYQLGAEGVRDYTAAVNDNGAAQRMAAERLDNLRGDLEQFGGSVDTITITFLRFTQGPLRQLVQTGTRALNMLIGLPQEVQQTIVLMGLLATAVMGAVGAWAAFGDKIVLAVRGLLALSGPLLIVTAVVTGLYLAWQNNFLGIQSITRRVIGGIGVWLDRAAQFFRAAKERGLDPFRLAFRTLIVSLGERLGRGHPVVGFLQEVLRLGERLGDAFADRDLPAFLDELRRAGGRAGRWLEEQLNDARTFGATLLQRLLASLRGVNWDLVGSTVSGALHGALDLRHRVIEGLLSFGGQVLQGLVESFRGVNWTLVGDRVREGLGGLADWIGDALGGELAFAATLLQRLLDGFRGINWDLVGNEVQAGLQGALSGLSGWVADRVGEVDWDAVKFMLAGAATLAFTAIITAARNELLALRNLGGWVLDRLGEVNWEQVKQTLLTAGGDTLGSLLRGMQDTVNHDLWPWFASVFPALLTWLSAQGLPDLVARLVSGGAEMIGGLLGALERNWPQISSFFVDVLIPGILGAMAIGPTLLIAAGFGIITGLLTGLKQIWDRQLGPWLGERKAAILGYLQGASDWLLTTGQEVSDGLLRGMQNLWSQQVAPWFIGRKNAIVNSIRSAGTWLFDTGKAIVQGLWDGATEQWRKFAAWWDEQLGKLPIPEFNFGVPKGGYETPQETAERRRREGRALGGPVAAMQPYWVGERGRPELFVPSTSGRILTERQAAGLGTTVVHQTNYITVSLHEIEEMVEAGRFVRDLGQTRTLYLEGV